MTLGCGDLITDGDVPRVCGSWIKDLDMVPLCGKCQTKIFNGVRRRAERDNILCHLREKKIMDKCPRCGIGEIECDEVDVGVGVIKGNCGCQNCYWTPDESLQFTPGVYQHYKGPKYLALFVARHSETEERLVVYMPLEPKDGEAPILCARPAYGPEGFFTPKENVTTHTDIVTSSELVERFALLYPVAITQYERPRAK